METYAKTPKGQDEIAHRTHGLGLRARRLLILVDGQRSVEDLRGLTGGRETHTSPAPVARANTGHAASLPLARDFMINTLRTFHGPYAKLDLVKRIHATQSGGELRRLIMEWQQSIAESRLGRKRADELLARLEEVMPG